MNLTRKARLDNRVLLAMGALQLLGAGTISCKGTQTAVDFTVRVGVDTCKEDSAAVPVENELVTLDCVSASGEGTVKVRFPRRAWWNIQARDVGNTPNVPGK